MNENNAIDPKIREFLKQNAKKGGETLKQQKGKAYYSEIAKKRWAAKKAKQAA